MRKATWRGIDGRCVPSGGGRTLRRSVVGASDEVSCEKAAPPGDPEPAPALHAAERRVKRDR